MEQFIEWLKGLDYTALYALIGTAVATWGGSIIALVVGLLKLKVKNFNYQSALEKVQLKLSQEQTAQIEALKESITNQLTDVQKNIITNNNLQAEKRLEVINSIKEETEVAFNDLKAINADDMFEELK